MPDVCPTCGRAMGHMIKWRKDEVIEALQRYEELTGRVPSAARVDKDAPHIHWLPSTRTIIDLFGTWNEALEAAGFQTRRPAVPAQT